MEGYLEEGCLNHLSDLGGFREVRNDELRPGFVRNVVTVPLEAANLYRSAHGGFLMQLVDVAACMAAWSLGRRVVTQQVSLNFVHGVRLGDTVSVESEAVHVGASTILVETTIRDSAELICLLSMATLFIVGQVRADDPLPEPYLGRNPGV